MKGKRRVVRSLVEKVRHKFEAVAAEVRDNDLWRKAKIGIALVGSGSQFLESRLQQIMKFIENQHLTEIYRDYRFSAGTLLSGKVRHVKHRTHTDRPHRVAELLRERLALILLNKCADPRLQELTLTEVEMSPDLKQAKIFYVMRGNVDQTMIQMVLDNALGFIKQEVAKENLFRLMPAFFFLPDSGLDRAAQLEKLFEAARERWGLDEPERG